MGFPAVRIFLHRRNIDLSKIQIDRLTFAYEGSYDNVFEDVSFQLDSNWKLGLRRQERLRQNHTAAAVPGRL